MLNFMFFQRRRTRKDVLEDIARAEARNGGVVAPLHRGEQEEETAPETKAATVENEEQ